MPRFSVRVAPRLSLRAILVSALACGLVTGVRSDASAQAASPPNRTIGLVLTSLFTAIYETRYMDECPEGLAVGNDELWLQTMTPAERERATAGGTKNHIDRKYQAEVRGPHGEDSCWYPELLRDPPLRTVQGTTAYGFNLDGTTDGHATPKSCAHQKFVGLDGEPGIDNQIYRVVGCIKGFRHDGYVETTAQTERINTSRGITLIEVSDVDDARNDPDVKVAFYRPKDQLLKDSAANVLPFASYAIDPTYAEFTHGKIVDGVLSTDPVDVHLPFQGDIVISELDLRDMRLRLELAADGSGATGLMGGYYNWSTWWDFIRKIQLTSTSIHSCPALYDASRKLADGYPDPKTGECTAISTAYRVAFLPAFIIHPASEKRISGTAANR